jgi:hypothetical protein
MLPVRVVDEVAVTVTPTPGAVCETVSTYVPVPPRPVPKAKIAVPDAIPEPESTCPIVITPDETDCTKNVVPDQRATTMALLVAVIVVLTAVCETETV